jgi:hypothetical protein
LLALLGCHKAGSGLVDVEIALDTGAPAVDRVVVWVSAEMPAEAPPLNRQGVTWMPGAGGKMRLGLYVPSSVSGTVWVHADGLMGGKIVAAASPRSTAVRPGEVSSRVTLVLAPGASMPDGGAPPGPADGSTPDARPADGGRPPTDSWSPGQKIENDPVEREFEAVVAVDPVKGNALVAFVEKQARVKVIRYDAAGARWGEPLVVASGGRINSVRVAMDGAGHALVIWTDAAGGSPTEGVSESHSGDGGVTFSAPARLHQGSMCLNPGLAVGRNGRARAVWEETLDDHNVMLTAYYDGSAWSPAAMPLASNDSFSNRTPSVVVDPAGGGFVFWKQPEPTSPRASTHLYVAHFAGAALDPPQFLDRDPGAVNDAPASAMSADGRGATVVWKQNYQGSGAGDFLASLWSPAGGWTAPARAVPGAGDRPSVAMDGSGAVTLVYETILNTGTRNAMVARREAGKDWSAPFPLEDDNMSPGGFPMEEDQLSPVVTTDGRGDVQVAWRKRRAAPTYALVARRLIAGKGWEPAITVAVRDKLAVSWPLSMATTDAGRSLLAWVYLDPTAMAMDPDAYMVFASFFPP